MFLAQWMDRKPTTRMISPYALHAPEVILEANFDCKVDIWSLGCMVGSASFIDPLFTFHTDLRAPHWQLAL